MGLFRSIPCRLQQFQTPQCAAQVLTQARIGSTYRRRPGDQYIVIARRGANRQKLAGQCAQAPPRPVAGDRVADFFAGCETKAYIGRGFATACLKHKPWRSAPIAPLRHMQKFSPAAQLPQRCWRLSHGATVSATPDGTAARSGAQALPASGAAGRNYLAAALRRHARAKAMTPFAHQPAGLKGAFHIQTPRAASQIAVRPFSTPVVMVWARFRSIPLGKRGVYGEARPLSMRRGRRAQSCGNLAPIRNPPHLADHNSLMDGEGTSGCGRRSTPHINVSR